MLFNGCGSRLSSNKFDKIKDALCRLISINTTDLTTLPLTHKPKIDETYNSMPNARKSKPKASTKSIEANSSYATTMFQPKLMNFLHEGRTTVPIN